MSWTEDRVATLKKLWLEGQSASQIAKQLGGVTRNAVIGKVHRLGLSGRAAPSQPSRAVFKAPPRVRPSAPSTPQVASVAAPAAPSLAAAPRRLEPVVRALAPAQPVASLDEVKGSATVLTLGAHMCKWPIGDPSSDEFTFCGRRAAEGIPYCTEHAKVAYQPQQKKKSAGGGADLARSLRRYL